MSLFYQNLYKCKETSNLTDSTKFNHVPKTLPYLSDMDKINLDKDITIPELQTIIIKSKNNKSPGPDGFSNQFF